jgi:hypothetical protein
MLLVFSTVQLLFVLSAPYVFDVDYNHAEVVLSEGITKAEAIEALNISLRNEQYYRSAITKLYKGLLFEVLVVFILTFYFRSMYKQLRN